MGEDVTTRPQKRHVAQKQKLFGAPARAQKRKMSASAKGTVFMGLRRGEILSVEAEVADASF